MRSQGLGFRGLELGFRVKGSTYLPSPSVQGRSRQTSSSHRLAVHLAAISPGVPAQATLSQLYVEVMALINQL